MNAMTDDPKKGKEGATFFTMWLCFSNILAFIKTIFTPTADPAWPPVKAFHPQTECLLPLFTYQYIDFFFPPHCHCHYTMCILEFWKALFRKCLLNNRKVQANIRKYLLCVLQKKKKKVASYLFIFLNCVFKNELDSVKLDPSLG